MLDLIIIGAGLSGLRAALTAESLRLDYQVLEARNRIGGRALGSGGSDLGPSWIWPAHQPRVRDLVDQLALRCFPQCEDGLFRYEAAGGLQSLTLPRRYQDAARIAGGPSALAGAMAGRLQAGRIALEAEVTGLDGAGAGLSVSLADGSAISAQKVIVATPPRLVLGWAARPDLPDALRSGLDRWPTWMAAHAKAYFRYERPFWREAGFSGGAVSQVGPLMEVVDHSDDEAGRYALFGFYGWPVAVRRRRADHLMDETLAQLTRLFGPQAGAPVETGYKDWAEDRFTAAPGDWPGPREHPPYGEPALAALWFDSRLAFAGAEAATGHGGLIEGALEAADAAMARLSFGAAA